LLARCCATRMCRAGMNDAADGADDRGAGASVRPAVGRRDSASWCADIVRRRPGC
jgi:hypothetical protein